jgi:SNF2 family DNA or RNA helicase
MFQTYQLGSYFGDNPYIKQLCQKFYNFVGTQTNVDFLQFEDYLTSYKKPKIIYVSKTYYKWYKEKLNRLNEERKKPLTISLKYHYNIQSDGFVPIFENDFTLNSFENEYLLFNFRFTPINISHSINIWGENKTLIKNHFNTDKEVDNVKIDAFLGETNEYFHLKYKKHNFFLYKKYCEHPINKLWQNIDLDVERLNNLHKKYDLMPHQIDAVKFLSYHKKTSLLDDMGLGKTISSIAAMINCNANKVLVITLSTLKYNWKREIEMFNQSVKVISGNKWDFDDTKFTVINGEILKNFVRKEKNRLIGELLDEQYDGIIIDEGHKFKNPKAKKVKLLNTILRKSPIKYLFNLTGTLMQNNIDFYNVYSNMGLRVPNLIEPYNYNLYKNYVLRYCNGYVLKIKNKDRIVIGKKENDIIQKNSNTSELHNLTKYYYLRRTKKQELKGFVNKYEYPIYFSLSLKERATYNKLLENYLKALEENGVEYSTPQSEKLVESVLLRQFLAEKKVSNTVDFVKSKIEDDEKCIIFTNYKKEFELIKNKFNPTELAYVEGGKSQFNQEQVDRFQEDENVKVILGNIMRLGTGVNLTKAQNIIFNSPNWNSIEHSQAFDRAYRIGQENDVYGYLMIFEDTEEEKVLAVNKNKEQNINKFYNE